MNKRSLLTKIRSFLAILMLQASIGTQSWAQVAVIGGVPSSVGGSAAAGSVTGLSAPNATVAPVLSPAVVGLTAALAPSISPAAALATPMSAAARAEKKVNVVSAARKPVSALKRDKLGRFVPAGKAKSADSTVKALAEKLAVDLKAVGEKAGTTENSQTAGRAISNTLAGGSDAAVGGDVSPDASAGIPADASVGLPAGRPRNVLEKMGLREKILTGGGLELDAAGRIKPVAEPVHMQAYDNDNNIAYYPTRIYVRHKTSHEEISMPQAKFAEARTTIGISGEYKDYELFGSYGHGSFRDSLDVENPDIFLKDTVDAIDGTHSAMFRGPAWFAFAQTMRNPKRAPWAAVVTSRGHEPESMVRGFDVFKDRGLLTRSPRKEMIFGVANTAVASALQDPAALDPEKKVEVLIALIDLLEEIPLANPGDRHTFSFSDDDLDMITRVMDKLSQEQAIGRRWPHVKLSLFSTAVGKESRTELVAGLRKSTHDDLVAVSKETVVPPPPAAPLASGAPEAIPQAGTTYPGDAAAKARKVTDTIFVVYDLETTGIHPEINAPVDLGAVKFRVKTDGSIEVLGTFNQLIDPKAPMPAEVTLFTNITNGDLQGKPTIDQVLPKFRAFIGEDAVLLGHNVGFDVGFLGVQMKKHGIAPMPNMVLDTRELVKNLFPDILDRRLAELIALWELASVEDHTGLSDATHTAEVFARVLKRMAELKNSGVSALTVADAAEKSPNFHFDTILETLAGVPVKNPIKADAESLPEIQAKAQALFWQRKPSQLRDVAVALGMDYDQMRGVLAAQAATAAVSPADAIVEEISANPSGAVIFDYDALVERSSRQEEYPPAGDDVVEGLVRLLKSGRPVGIVASYGLEDDSALRARIPAALRGQLYFSRAGARPLYDAMRAGGVNVAAKNWLVVGTNLSVAEALPDAKIISVGDYVKDAPAPNARHMGIKGPRASLRMINAIAVKSARSPKPAKVAAPAAAVAGAKKAAEGRRVSFVFNWEDIVRAHPGKTLDKAVTRPKSVWQGANWFDFVNALSNKELAQNVHIVGRTSAEMASDLETLHALGLIKHLPESKNLRPLTTNPAKTLAAMMEILDALQAAPNRANSNKIFNADGTAKALRHLFTAADGDWSHYVATRKALAAQIQKSPKRWSRVKIVLRYTGADAAAKKGPVEVALTSEGKVRPLLITEYAEPFSGRFSEKQAPDVREKILPIETSVHSPAASVDDAITGMFFSHAYGNTDQRVVDNDDVVARERNAIAAFVADKKIPAARKHIVLTRYHVEDELLAKILVDAFKAGIRVDFLTDFNDCLVPKFASAEQEMLVDFSNPQPTADARGKFMQILLDGGFQIVGNGSKAQPRGAIYSQPIFNRNVSKWAKMIPIMHEKSLIFVVEPKAGIQAAPEVVDYYFGTANLSNHKRVNRLFQLRDKQSLDYALEHAQKLMEGFRAGQANIEAERPHRVYFEDGSFMEQAVTNGRYNLNGRIIDILQRGARGELKIERITLSHFAPTKSNLFPALSKAMDAQKNFRGYSISDDKFTGVDTYGKVAVTGGFLVTPPLGGPGWGWRGDHVKRMQALVYLHGIEGRVETDPDGAPTEREVWHDKTTLIHVNEGGRRWVYVFTGSFNASNKEDNAELQFMFRFPAESHWVKGIEDSIVKTVERQKAHVQPLAISLVRGSIARAAAMSPLYVPIAVARALVEATKTRDTSALEPLFTNMIADASRVLGESFQPRRAAMRLKKMLKFMEYFHSERENGRVNYPLIVQKLVALATVIGNMDGGMTNYNLKSQLNKVLWDPTADKDEMEDRVSRAWDMLEIEAPMPRREASWGGTRKDPRKIKEAAAPFVPQIAPGNRLVFKNKKAFKSAVEGASTVYLKGGIGKDHKVGPGRLEFEGTDQALPVSIDSIEEMPFSKVTVAIMNRLAPGMTKAEFFASMKKRYPGFTRNSMVTVLGFHVVVQKPSKATAKVKTSPKKRS